MKIGRKIYYDNRTGEILADTGERSGRVRETTQEEDYAAFSALSERNPETVGSIQLEYGQNADDFNQAILSRVDPETKQLYFTYPDPEETGGQTPENTLPLTEQIKTIKSENEDLKVRLSDVESTLTDILLG